MRPPIRRPVPRDQGFTLIELMVVITIIGLLAGLVGLNAIDMYHDAQVRTTKAQMREIEAAIDIHSLRHRRIPESLDELVGEHGALRADAVPTDAWDNAFVYEPRGARDYDLISLGADGTEGGEDHDADLDRASLSRDATEVP